MKDESVLVPVDERNVDFYGDEIVTALVKVEDHFQMYVPLRPICKYLCRLSGLSSHSEPIVVAYESAKDARKVSFCHNCCRDIKRAFTTRFPFLF